MVSPTSTSYVAKSKTSFILMTKQTNEIYQCCQIKNNMSVNIVV